MGKDYNNMIRKATRELQQLLSDGQGMTINDMIMKVRWNHGLGRAFVEEFLELFETAIKEDNGVYLWKA